MLVFYRRGCSVGTRKHGRKRLEIPGGNHAGFGCYGKQSGDGESDITAGEQWDITEKAIREFVDSLSL
ncbi:MAG: hypothetical protein J6B57_00020 [Oscillospiraceae bacterium]|nr:hypothetical protein [Oscillospiraceae bacterium]